MTPLPADTGTDAAIWLPPEEAILEAAHGIPCDDLGWSVALSADGSRALVGAARTDLTGGPDAACARVFARTGMTLTEEAGLWPHDRPSDFGVGPSR